MTFRGSSQIRTYQFLILKHLFSEWIRRSDTDNTTYSINTPLQGNSNGNEQSVIEDILQDNFNDPYEKIVEKESKKTLKGLLNRFSEEDRIYIKLMSFLEVEIEPDDIRAISRISGKNLHETMEYILDLENSLTKRYELYKNKKDELNKIDYWILTYEKKLKKREETKGLEFTEKEVINEKKEIERKLLWRKKQKEKLLNEYSKSSPKVSYREIAKILNVSVGTVSSKIKTVRARLDELLK